MMSWRSMEMQLALTHFQENSYWVRVRKRLNMIVLEISLRRSKYEESVYINSHTTVWGSWWKDHHCGYKCCKQTIRNSYCTGAAGIEAAEATADLMKANIARKEAAEDTHALVEKKRLATWGTEVPEDLILD